MPSRYREDLQSLCGGRLIVTKHPHGCLMIFPRPYWETFRDQVAQLPFSQVGVKRVFLGHAEHDRRIAAGWLAGVGWTRRYDAWRR